MKEIELCQKPKCLYEDLKSIEYELDELDISFHLEWNIVLIFLIGLEYTWKTYRESHQ